MVKLAVYSRVYGSFLCRAIIQKDENVLIEITEECEFCLMYLVQLHLYLLFVKIQFAIGEISRLSVVKLMKGILKGDTRI